MALDRTSGFDMLVQISENELNDQLATAFLAGDVIPAGLSVPFSNGGVTGTADINFNTPVADLDRPRPRIGLTIPFSGSQLQITTPVPVTIAPLGGTITVVDSIQMISLGSSQLAAMDFNSGAPDVSVVLDAASAALLAPLLAATGQTVGQVQNMMAGFVLAELQSSIGRLDLTPAIEVFDDDDATTIFDIDVTTVNDTSALDRDCLTFGVRMANDSGGNINGVTTSMIPTGSESLVMMSNFWLLAQVMRPKIADSLDRPVTDFDTPLRLNRSIPAPGGEGTLTNLEATVVGNRIRVTGRATASGTGWSAVSNFTFFIEIGLEEGEITVNATEPVVDTDVDLEWWVWLASLGLGALFGGIIGAIVAAVVLAIVESVAEGIANGMISDGLSGSIGDIPSIPLGPIGGGLTLTSIVLDDLELRSTIARSLKVPVKSQGSRTALTGFALDLDTGLISPDVRLQSDLVWDPASGLSANGSSGLTVTGTSYRSLTPVQISRFPLSSSGIARAYIPLAAPPSFPFLRHDEVVFGMRTTDGRMAKVRAWRSRFEAGALHLDWVTFDTPTPSLEIAGRWTVLEKGEVTESITPNCSFCRSYPVSWCGIFEAWPRLATFPIDFQWCLCGEVLAEGAGEVSTKNGPLAYRLDGRRLYIETELGQPVDCELCVSAIDARGQELFTCIRVRQSGLKKHCRKCDPRKPHVRVQMLAAEAALANWRPLLGTEADKTTVREIG